MKITRKMQLSGMALAAGLMLGGTTSVMGQATDWFQGFDAAGNETSWVNWWGLTTVFTWDSQDASNNPASGCQKFTVPFTGAAGEQIMTFVGFHGGGGWDGGTILDGTFYTNLWFDIKMDPTSSTGRNGQDYGWWEIGFTEDGWNWVTVGNPVLPLTATNWTRVQLPINTSLSGLNKINGYFFKMWSDGNITNTYIFYLDNVRVEASKIPPPLPTVSLEKPQVGLNFIAASGGQWDRQTIRTVGNRYSWIGAPGDVDYSFNLANLEKAGSSIDFKVYFGPGTPTVDRADVDWHETNVFFLNLSTQNDGAGWADMRYKTNAPESNGHMYDNPPTISTTNGSWNPTVAGRWTIRFNQDTNVYIINPSGWITTNVIPQDVIDILKQYGNNMQVSFGIGNNSTAKVGNKGVVLGIDITGLPEQPAVHSDFLANPVDPLVWFTVASSAQWGVTRITSDNPYWLNWTLPAADFGAEKKASLTSGSWATVTNAGWDGGSKHHVLLANSDLPAANSGYFHLIKRTATKLLLLLPGETLAPGTPTGKTGTPTAQHINVGPFTVRVYAVDDQFYQVPTVNLNVGNWASTDSYWAPPADGTITAGYGAFDVGLMGTLGPQTITVEDKSTTGTLLAPSTSSSFNVIP